MAGGNISHWKVTYRSIASGHVRTATARVLVNGSGALSVPRECDVDGHEQFKGPLFHSAKWDTSVDTRGKNVVVLGNGCSATQIVPSIAKQAKSVTQIVRAKHWRGIAKAVRPGQRFCRQLDTLRQHRRAGAIPPSAHPHAGRAQGRLQATRVRRRLYSVSQHGQCRSHQRPGASHYAGRGGAQVRTQAAGGCDRARVRLPGGRHGGADEGDRKRRQGAQRCLAQGRGPAGVQVNPRARFPQLLSDLGVPTVSRGTFRHWYAIEASVRLMTTLLRPVFAGPRSMSPLQRSAGRTVDVKAGGAGEGGCHDPRADARPHLHLGLQGLVYKRPRQGLDALPRLPAHLCLEKRPPPVAARLGLHRCLGVRWLLGTSCGLLDRAMMYTRGRAQFEEVKTRVPRAKVAASNSDNGTDEDRSGVGRGMVW
ncbi:hypothetical protein L1887_58606 [Cichorium endivia]|nr:hypothetical protein L1887_58606 [Cichorium endivia]